ncbi:hypothetical protein F383_38676 [Gossypium arboreum]|uniref:Uncharacterized protein n=1 Tax=Gossypium arboreum TaxID=29729 RepID=A0A0B0MLZ2_GOSAR|nr:hypothetical protein F383_38676 [Gossypium arboreum]
MPSYISRNRTQLNELG